MEKENTTWIRSPLNMEKRRRFRGVLIYIVKKTRIPKRGEEEDVGFHFDWIGKHIHPLTKKKIRKKK